MFNLCCFPRCTGVTVFRINSASKTFDGWAAADPLRKLTGNIHASVIDALCSVFFRGRVSEIEKSEPRPETAEHVRGEQLLPGHRRPADRTRGRPVGDLDLRSRASGTLLYRQPPRRPEQQVLRLRLSTPVQPQRVGPIQPPRPEHRFHVPA